MWHKTKVPVVWDTSFKHFNYIDDPITGVQDTVWRKQGYNHERTYGSMYGHPNRMPEWVLNVSKYLKLKKCGFVFYKMKTLDIMPLHVDHYKKYCDVFEVDYEQVFRAVVFLENWQSGHYFEIDEEAIVNWSAGDVVMWQGNIPHSASNIGISDRYTLQITGII